MHNIQNKGLRFRDLRFAVSNLFRISNFEFRAFSTRGFTLVEILVAFGMFSIIMMIAVGSLLSLLEANRKAETLKTVVNNLHFAFENISRNIRTGASYHCGSGDVSLPADCPSDPRSQIVFKARDGDYMLYAFDGGAIKRSKNRDVGLLLNHANWIPITAPEITLELFQLYVDGTGKNDRRQPRVLIVAQGSMQGKSKVISRFDIETLVSQRMLDI